jgi:hypothetical protein
MDGEDFEFERYDPTVEEAINEVCVEIWMWSVWALR